MRPRIPRKPIARPKQSRKPKPAFEMFVRGAEGYKKVGLPEKVSFDLLVKYGMDNGLSAIASVMMARDAVRKAYKNSKL